MDAASKIRNSMETVALLRAKAAAQPELGAAVAAIKRLQAARFRNCYADLMVSLDFGAASRFFLEELYGDADYALRDQQFARIAGTLATVFPASVVETAVALSQLHALTEELDHV
ncbi:MAG: FFLEELY motif protein, partial [Rhodoferax sp.]